MSKKSERSYQPDEKRVFAGEWDDPNVQNFEGLDFSPGGRDSAEADVDPYGVAETVERHRTGWDPQSGMRPPAPDDSWSGLDKSMAENPPAGNNSFLRQQADDKRLDVSQRPLQASADMGPGEITSRKLDTEPVDIPPPAGSGGFASARIPGLRQAVMQMLTKATPQEEYPANNEVDESGINKAASVGPKEEATQAVSATAPEQTGMPAAMKAEAQNAYVMKGGDEQGKPNPKAQAVQSSSDEGPDSVLAAVTKYLDTKGRPQSDPMLPYLRASYMASTGGKFGDPIGDKMRQEEGDSKEFNSDMDRKKALVQELLRQKFEGGEKAKDRDIKEKEFGVTTDLKKAQQEQARQIALQRQDMAEQRLKWAQKHGAAQEELQALAIDAANARAEAQRLVSTNNNIRTNDTNLQIFKGKSLQKLPEGLPTPEEITAEQDLGGEFAKGGDVPGMGAVSGAVARLPGGQSELAQDLATGGHGKEAVRNQGNYDTLIAEKVKRLYGTAVSGHEKETAQRIFGNGWLTDQAKKKEVLDRLTKMADLAAQQKLAGMPPDVVDEFIKRGGTLPPGTKVPGQGGQAAPSKNKVGDTREKNGHVYQWDGTVWRKTR